MSYSVLTIKKSMFLVKKCNTCEKLEKGLETKELTILWEIQGQRFLRSKKRLGRSGMKRL